MSERLTLRARRDRVLAIQFRRKNKESWASVAGFFNMSISHAKKEFEHLKNGRFDNLSDVTLDNFKGWPNEKKGVKKCK